MTKTIVLPGEKVEGKPPAYVYSDGGENYAMVFGVMDRDGELVKIVPLRGKYLPVEEDYIIGVINDVKFGGYTIDINSPYSAFLPSKREYRHGDVIFAMIVNANEVRSVELGDERKLVGGDVIEISPVRIPRVIGKNSSMVTMIAEKTKTEIFVGRNGRIWLKGENMSKAENAILKIEREAHTDGLTDRIKEYLEKGD